MNALALGDIHAPYQHPDILDFIDALVEVYEPAEVVSIGDESDIHHVPWHTQHPDCFGPDQEYEYAREFFHEELFPRFPELRVCNSNHGNRYQRIMKAGDIPAPVRHKLSLNYIWDIPTWEWKDAHIIDGIVFRHGDKGFRRYVDRAKRQLEYNTVSGHYHTDGGVAYYTRLDGKAAWSAATGCLINPASPAFEYTDSAPVLGSLIIEHGTPIFCPLKTDKHGRWTGEL